MFRTHMIVRLEPPAGATPEQAEAAARDLYQEMLEVPGVDPAPQEPAAPSDHKGVELGELAVVALSVVAEAPTLYQLAGSMLAWLRRGGGDRIRACVDGHCIELDRASYTDQQRILDAWIERVQRPEWD